MDKLNLRKVSFPTLIMQLIAMLAISAFMAACQGNDGGGGVAAGNVWANGVGFVNAQQFGSVQSVNPMNQVSLALNVIVDNGATAYNGTYPNGYPGYGYPGYSNIGTNLNQYSGPVAFQGTMTLTTNWYDLYGSGCQVPPGTYTVDTVTPGTMAYAGMMSTVRLVANPGNIIMEINGGMINGNRLVAIPPGGIHVAQANGINCSPVFGGSFN
ncbi:hypothetical protein ACLSU7_00415 [Bdellovibrio sp. HCB185ZH]|uniref:hypothetical protein n=1 Tax=Bdellovibrio sp. HCB185ZH TaxID=3394235 RepID=UPI0039A677C9